MYNRSRKLLILNSVLFVVEAALTAFLLIRVRTERECVLPEGASAKEAPELTSSDNVFGSCYALVHESTGFGWIPRAYSPAL